MTDRDRETLKETAEWLEEEASRAQGTGMRLLREQRAKAIRSLLERLEAAEANYKFMVDRAADEHLEGYRELGERAAKAEEDNERLRAEVDDHKSGVREANKRWLECREENERLRAQIKGRTLVPELVEKDREVARLKACIDAALTIAEEADASGDLAGAIVQIRLALKGEGE